MTSLRTLAGNKLREEIKKAPRELDQVLLVHRIVGALRDDLTKRAAKPRPEVEPVEARGSDLAKAEKFVQQLRRRWQGRAKDLLKYNVELRGVHKAWSTGQMGPDHQGDLEILQEIARGAPALLRLQKRLALAEKPLRLLAETAQRLHRELASDGAEGSASAKSLDNLGVELGLTAEMVKDTVTPVVAKTVKTLLALEEAVQKWQRDAAARVVA
jgi:hypothetical protein